MKKLIDYLHLYLNSEIDVKITKCSYAMVHEHNYTNNDTRKISTTTYKWYEMGQCELLAILRPIRSMTEREMLECIKLTENSDEEIFQAVYWHNKWLCYQQKYPRMKYWMNNMVDFERLEPERFAWALKKGFDIFGLIEDGLAIEFIKQPQTVKKLK